jgi:hypothetical protein
MPVRQQPDGTHLRHPVPNRGQQLVSMEKNVSTSIRGSQQVGKLVVHVEQD